jgi:hypothetical protein
MNEIEQLHAWIAGSLRFRRKLRVVALIAFVIAIGVYWWDATWGIVALIIVGSVWGAGWWITYAHISDWHTRIELLQRRASGAR